MLRSGAILISALCCFTSAAAPAQTAESWVPTNDGAVQWLGTVRVTPTRILMKGGMSLSIQQSGVVSFKTDWGPTVSATVYRVTRQTTPRGMTNLCATSKVAFVLLSHPPAVGSDVSPREIDAFKGPRFSVSSPDYCSRTSFDAGGAVRP